MGQRIAIHALGGSLIRRCAATVAAASWLACCALAVQAGEPGSRVVALDVGIAVFAPCAADNDACRALTEPQLDSPLAMAAEESPADDIWPEIRRAEGYFMAVRVKAALQRIASPSPWGVVRVTPRASDAFDVNVEASILQSNAGGTEFTARVSDASEITWFECRYHFVDDGEATSFELPFIDLADDMTAWIREHLTATERERLRTVARMRFARSFSPHAFASHLIVDDAGVVRLNRLPAHDAPMLAHVRRILELEHRFIDALDNHYEAFSGHMAMPYRRWRDAIRDGILTRRQLNARAQARRAFGAIALVGGLSGQSGAEGPGDGLPQRDFDTVVSGVANLYSASRESDAVVAWVRMLERLGHATGAAISPYLLETENRTLRLTGAVNEQYDDLRRILGELYRANARDDAQVRAPGIAFQGRVSAVDDLVTRPPRPLPPLDTVPEWALELTGVGPDARLGDQDGTLFALGPDDDAVGDATRRVQTRRGANPAAAVTGGWDDGGMEAVFQYVIGQISPARGSAGTGERSMPRQVLAVPPSGAPVPDGSLQDLARQVQAHRHRGDDGGALRLLHEGLERIGILEQACPLACSFSPLESLPGERPARRAWTLGKSYDAVGVVNEGPVRRLQKAEALILEGRTDEGLDELGSLLRRARRLPRYALNGVARMHLRVAAVEGNRGNPDAAARIYERLLPVADSFLPSFEATLLRRIAQSNFLAGDYATSLDYLERWLPRSSVMAAACPAVCQGDGHPPTVATHGES